MGSAAPLPALLQHWVGMDFIPMQHTVGTHCCSAPRTQPSLDAQPSPLLEQHALVQQGCLYAGAPLFAWGREPQLGAVPQNRAQSPAHSRHCRVWGDACCYPSAIPGLPRSHRAAQQ